MVEAAEAFRAVGAVWEVWAVDEGGAVGWLRRLRTKAEAIGTVEDAYLIWAIEAVWADEAD